jgi:xanthine dehydrogenase YagR molybdenum-binding subunit
LAALTRYDLSKTGAAPHLLPSLVGLGRAGRELVPDVGRVVHYAGQPVVLVVAETYEQARYAATLVQATIAFSPVHGSAREAAEVERLDR